MNSNQIFAQAADSAIISTDTTIKDLLAEDSSAILQDTILKVDTIVASEIIQIKKQNGYKISGIVKDKNTGEGIPFATIFFPGTGTGTSADLDGNFSFSIATLPKDTINIQAVGYDKTTRLLSKDKNNYGFYIELGRAINTLEEFVVHAGEDPAVVLLKQIIAHKPQNDPDRTENYKYEVYNKLEVDIARLTKDQFEKLPVPFLKKFSFIYNNIDTTSEAKPFLPFYLTETISDYYFRSAPKKAREFIKASQVKGMKNESVTKFMGSMYQNINPYENFIPVFEKQFVSPISNQGLFYYKYKIKDTQTAYRHNIILVQFIPRRSGENCFYGDFWVVDSVFALQRISLEVPKDANINWVNTVSLYQEYAPVEDSLWFCVKDKLIADFIAPYGMKLPGFIGRKSTTYRDIIVNSQQVTDVLDDKKYKEDVVVADTARNATDAFWEAARPEGLSKNEQAIYHMVDTLNNLPMFIRYKSLIKFIGTGVKEFGPIEIGPIWNTYSSNPVEGSRFRFSMGTTTQLFKNTYINGYVAYGTKDEEFKYKIAGLWLLDRHPRMYVYGSYLHDVDQSSSFYDQLTNDNFFSKLFRKPNTPYKLAMVDDARIELFKEYFSGFSHSFTLLHRIYNPYDPLPYIGIFKDKEGAPATEVTATEVNVRLRFAYKEKFLDGNYLRVSLGSDYPIVEARYSVGLKNVWNSGYEYSKITLSVSDEIKIAPLGSIFYNIYGGRYFGTLPYPLLEIHPGNDFFYYNKYAFNMMNRYEFISDRYAGLNIEHNIGGGIFNYIPYVKKLKMRQFWTAKVLYGNLSNENKSLNLNKGYPFRTLDKDPYIELGTGISNILQLFRIDFVWRVSPKLLPQESNNQYFGIFGSIRFKF